MHYCHLSGPIEGCRASCMDGTNSLANAAFSSIATASPWLSMPWLHKRLNLVEPLLFEKPRQLAASYTCRAKSAAPAHASLCDLPSVELPGDGVEACMADRLDVPNDRQDVGRKLCRLCLAGHAHALDGAGGVRACPAAFHAPRRPPGPPWCVPKSPRARVQHDDSSRLAAFEALPFSRRSATALPALWRRLSQG
jgi:hypothetical protein